MNENLVECSSPPLVSVIVPAHNATGYLRRVLPALKVSTFKNFEVIVVNDHSSDDTAGVAVELGARVVDNELEANPSNARNRGVAQAAGELLVFIDSDVEPHPDALEKFVEGFETHPEVGAIFGSYDSDPASRSWISRFKNLMHHYVHQQHRGRAATFWTGCGAVRRRVFDQTGPFRPVSMCCVEDIDYGHRLNAAGFVVLLDPQIQGKHLKCWTLRSLLAADVLHRAVPWTIMMIDRRKADSTLNLGGGQMISALGALLIFPVVGLFSWDHAVSGVAVLLGSIAILNRPYLSCMTRLAGLRFALFCFGMLVFYYWYGIFGMGLGAILYPFLRSGKNRAASQAERG